jgi:hypothetical protein
MTSPRQTQDNSVLTNGGDSALFNQNMLELALELAVKDPTYEDFALRFAEHFSGSPPPWTRWVNIQSSCGTRKTDFFRRPALPRRHCRAHQSCPSEPPRFTWCLRCAEYGPKCGHAVGFSSQAEQ